MIDEIYEDTRESMGKSVSSLNNEYKKVRTGRASVSLLDGIRVDYYGTPTPLNQMATLSVPESRLIVAGTARLTSVRPPPNHHCQGRAAPRDARPTAADLRLRW